MYILVSFIQTISVVMSYAITMDLKKMTNRPSEVMGFIWYMYVYCTLNEWHECICEFNL